MQPKTVCLFSGGLDSTTLLYALRAQGHAILPFAVHYGQRHAKELQAAEVICQSLHLTLRIADMRHLGLFGLSSQTSPAVTVPLGHYADDTMKQTVVPNRNMVLLALATAYALQQEATAVAYAAHSGDHPIYPDCRPVFINAMREAMGVCDWQPVTLLTPFATWSKADIVTEGGRLGVPWAQTWSCYQGQTVHCGACGTCVERREAFVLAGVEDPTEYKGAPCVDAS